MTQAATAAFAAPENTASLALAAKLGFRQTCRTSYHGEPAVILQLQIKS